LTSIATIFALISMAGLPPMLGFIGKELVYDAKLQLPGLGWLILPLVIGANVIMIAISLTIYFEIFSSKSKKEPIVVKYHEKDFPWYFIAGPILLAVAGLVLGLMPGILDNLVGNALYAIKSQTVDVHLSLWHGFNDALLLSFVTVLSGILVFLYRRGITLFFIRQIERLNRFHMPTIFIHVMNFYLQIAFKNTKRLQHGYHRIYLMTFFIVTSLLTAFLVDWGSLFDVDFSLADTGQKSGLLVLIAIASFAAIYGVFSKSRLSAIVALGAVGYVIGLIYLLFGAVDLAITQLLVETVVMILFVMVIYYLPNFMVYSKTSTRVRDVFIALGVGVMVFFVVLHARFTNLHSPISEYFAENSVIAAHGRNIVNVILVDFRALDTLGEITVLALAAAGVYSLYKFKVK
jgi:multicomponent Na+:H+ antiporter subunit A